MRELFSNLKVAQVIKAAGYSADTTSSAIDLLGFEAAMIVANVGTPGITLSGTNKIELILLEADTSDGAYTAVAASDTHGGGASGIFAALTDNAAHGEKSYKVGYRGNKRFLKVRLDFSGTHGTASPISVDAILGKAHIAPVA